LRLYAANPQTPIIVMTHNRDRQLALDTIQAGAADFVIKDFTDGEELFRRILFAIEKYKHTIRCSPNSAGAHKRLEGAQEAIAKAKRTKSVPDMRAATVGATEVITDVSLKMFEEMANLSAQLTQQSSQQRQISKTVEGLDKDLLRGRAGRPSMKSQVDLIDHRISRVESDIKGLKHDVDSVEDTQQRAAVQITTTRITNRTKILLGILALIGTIAGAIVTYMTAIRKG